MKKYYYIMKKYFTNFNIQKIYMKKILIDYKKICKNVKIQKIYMKTYEYNNIF